MIDTDPSKSIRSITRDMRVSVFLNRQVVHEDIRYSSYKMKKGQFLSQAIKRQEERLCYEAFEQTQASPLAEHALVFLRRKKFPPGSDGEHTEYPLACCVPKACSKSD
ncbi:Hypothetical predicted protein [Octopus vulgaris]|uniref:Uncharacterized protein n=1 Tax=Octopus vulgaris TaxID=6645 RepID=A0AA36AIN9_OCTVU|nr:Hypothetical predicted protein [Octopus vulgaris]